MLQDPQRRHRQHLAQRGLLLGLRLVYRRPLPSALGYRRRRNSPRWGCSPTRPVDLGSPLHGVYELLGQAGAEGRRDGGGHLGRAFHQRGQKRALQGHPRRAPPTIWGSTSSCRAAPSYNDAVLRAFEQETGRARSIRPDIAGLMGAYGAALYAMARVRKSPACSPPEDSGERLPTRRNRRSARAAHNHCQLTVNTFADGGRFICGNRCERAAGAKRRGAAAAEPLRIQARAARMLHGRQRARAGASACRWG